MDFVQRFRPISNNNTSNAPVAGTDDFATIREVVLRKLSRPDLGTVGPVILVGDYALATWVMGEMGGQTLLKREGRHWRIIRPLAKVVAGVLWGLEKGDRSPVFCNRHA